MADRLKERGRMKRKLSPRQQMILDFIYKFMDEHQFPPTVRDIQAGCDISSTSVVDYNLHILQREGYLRRLPEVSRGIELLDGSRKGARRDVVRVPILGNIAAGEPLPIPSEETWRDQELESVELPPFLTKGKIDIYALRVKGFSMIDALIADGDLVLLEPIAQPENGDMVAAWLTDRQEVTLKRFYLEGNKVRLQPENTTMEPIMVPANKVAVRGRVVGVVRAL
jgi:repressor LexA